MNPDDHIVHQSYHDSFEIIHDPFHQLYPTNIEKTVQIKHNNISNQDSELSN
jgi:hypothetical protein